MAENKKTAGQQAVEAERARQRLAEVQAASTRRVSERLRGADRRAAGEAGQPSGLSV